MIRMDLNRLFQRYDLDTESVKKIKKMSETVDWINITIKRNLYHFEIKKKTKIATHFFMIPKIT